jgi:hypothetical protein
LRIDLNALISILQTYWRLKASQNRRQIVYLHFFISDTNIAALSFDCCVQNSSTNIMYSVSDIIEGNTSHAFILVTPSGDTIEILKVRNDDRNNEMPGDRLLDIIYTQCRNLTTLSLQGIRLNKLSTGVTPLSPVQDLSLTKRSIHRFGLEDISDRLPSLDKVIISDCTFYYQDGYSHKDVLIVDMPNTAFKTLAINTLNKSHMQRLHLKLVFVRIKEKIYSHLQRWENDGSSIIHVLKTSTREEFKAGRLYEGGYINITIRCRSMRRLFLISKDPSYSIRTSGDNTNTFTIPSEIPYISRILSYFPFFSYKINYFN